ncbi:MAG: GntR family transcriptional regulator [Ardenticatenaceae bacterium]|nr:GntR family transcriptional regulator [Ardenticatenaceae bacterium]
MSLTEQAYKRIKHMILTEELPPATPIDLHEMTGLLGVGKTPVREALQRLALEKLIIISPRRGTFVTDLSIIQLQQALDARLIIERHTVRIMASKITECEVAALRKLIQDIEQLSAHRDYLGAVQVDERFHLSIAEATGNDYLADFLSLLLPVTMRFWYRGFRQSPDPALTTRTTYDAHQAIIDGLERHDADAAERAMVQHISAFRKEAVERIMTASAVNWATLVHKSV